MRAAACVDSSSCRGQNMTQNPSSSPPPAPSTPPAKPQPIIFQRPPRLLALILMLLIEPRQWAIAARYRVTVILWPFLLVLFASSLLTGYPMASRIMHLARRFAVSYDKSFDPMLLTNGRLSVIPTPGKKPLKIVGSGGKLIVRPNVTGLYRDTSMPMVMVLTQNHLIYTGSWAMFATPRQSISVRQLQTVLAQSNGMPIGQGKNGQLLPPPVKVSSATLLALINSNHATITALITVMFGMVIFLSNGLWSVLMIVMISPLIAMINRPNQMPLGRAYRISMALMVPLLAIRSLLVLFHIVPLEDQSMAVSFLMFISPLPLAIWAAVLSARMYAPQKKRGPST